MNISHSREVSQENLNAKVLGVYHKNCIDGTASASVLLMKYPNANVFSFNHNYSPDEFNNLLSFVDEDTIVYILDFSFNIDDLQRLIERSKKVVLIDHHITSKEKLGDVILNKDKFEFIFDTNHSGSMLTYKYFFKNKNNKIIEFIEDRDIWKWEFGKHTEYVNSYLFLFVENPQSMKEVIENVSIEDILNRGKSINEYKNKIVNNILEKNKEIYITIGDYKVPSINVNMFQSEIGSILCKKHDSAVCLFNISSDRVILSFRSLDHHDPSALDLAKLVGGGGHKNAAGATVNINDFIKMIQS